MLATVTDISDAQVQRAVEESAVGLDVETTGLNELSDKLVMVQIGYRNGDAVLVRPKRWDEASRLRALLAASEVTKIITAGAWDTSFLVRAGFELKSLACTKTMVKIIEGPSCAEHRLAPILKRYLGIELTKHHGTGRWDAEILSQELLQGAANDVSHLVVLWEHLSDRLRQNSTRDVDLQQLASDLAEQLPSISKLRQLGFNIDAKRTGEIFDF